MMLRAQPFATMVACALVIGTATAQDAPKTDDHATGKQTDRKDTKDELQGRICRSTKLVGTNVKNTKGEKIGEIDDLVIDKSEGVVAFGVLSFGGFLGMGEKLFAIPFSAVNKTKDGDTIVMDISKEQLESAPSFKKDAWPEFDRAYGTKVYEHYKTTPYWSNRDDKAAQNPLPTPLPPDALDKQPLRDRGMVRATKAIGMDVEDAEGKNLGDVDDLVIDDGSGRVVYAVLSFGGFLGMGDKLFAIPWHALKPSAKDTNKLMLDVPKDKLKNAPGFDKKSWPNMADQRWGLDVHKFYGEKPYWDSKSDRRDSGN
jgi:sporulation protein YlmC with PRC-barrel domain